MAHDGLTACLILYFLQPAAPRSNQPEAKRHGRNSWAKFLYSLSVLLEWEEARIALWSSFTLFCILSDLGDKKTSECSSSDEFNIAILF